MLDELGLADKMHWRETHMGYWYDGRLQPWGNPIALLTFRGLSLVAKIRYGLMVFFATKRNNWSDLDALEATAWIKRWVGEEAYEILWRRLFEYKFYHFTGNLSAAWIWSRIRRMGRSRYNLFKEKLGYLEGGSQTLLNALECHLREHGADLRLGCPVQKVSIDGGVELPLGASGDHVGQFAESVREIIVLGSDFRLGKRRSHVRRDFEGKPNDHASGRITGKPDNRGHVIAIRLIGTPYRLSGRHLNVAHGAERVADGLDEWVNVACFQGISSVSVDASSEPPEAHRYGSGARTAAIPLSTCCRSAARKAWANSASAARNGRVREYEDRAVVGVIPDLSA